METPKYRTDIENAPKDVPLLTPDGFAILTNRGASYKWYSCSISGGVPYGCDCMSYDGEVPEYFMEIPEWIKNPKPTGGE